MTMEQHETRIKQLEERMRWIEAILLGHARSSGTKITYYDKDGNVAVTLEPMQAEKPNQ